MIDASAMGADQVPLARCMARVEDDRQMGLLPHQRNDGEVRRVAGRGLEGADAAFAQHHVRIAAQQDILRRTEPLLERAGKAALQDDRLSDLADLGQEIEVLHVPRADLEDVHVFGNELHMFGADHFGDDEQTRLLPHLVQKFQPAFAQPLEAVRTGPRLVRAAPQHRHARSS